MTMFGSYKRKFWNSYCFVVDPSFVKFLSSVLSFVLVSDFSQHMCLSYSVSSAHTFCSHIGPSISFPFPQLYINLLQTHSLISEHEQARHKPHSSDP